MQASGTTHVRPPSFLHAFRTLTAPFGILDVREAQPAPRAWHYSGDCRDRRGLQPNPRRFLVPSPRPSQAQERAQATHFGPSRLRTVREERRICCYDWRYPGAPSKFPRGEVILRPPSSAAGPAPAPRRVTRPHVARVVQFFSGSLWTEEAHSTASRPQGTGRRTAVSEKEGPSPCGAEEHNFAGSRPARSPHALEFSRGDGECLFFGIRADRLSRTPLPDAAVRPRFQGACERTRVDQRDAHSPNTRSRLEDVFRRF